MPRHISILFPGQGSQHIGMLDNLPTELVESFRGLALKALNFDLIDLIKNGNEIYKFHNSNINNLVGCFGVCLLIDYIILFVHFIHNALIAS